jgi:hypothetical protein
MASMAFLLLFGVITYGHIRICGQTGANAIVLWFGLVINLALFIFLVLNGIQSNPAGVIVLVIALAATGWIQYRYQCIPKLGRQ